MSPEITMQRARADHLLSKLIAGGLSAGVVLLWWPHVVSHDGGASWVARGIAWTLLAEILILALSPLELMLRSRLAALAPVGSLRRLGGRFHLLAYAVLAVVALGLPLTLIATGDPAPAAPPKQVTNVTRVVKVVKPVQVKRIVVRRTVRAAAPAAPYVPPAVTPPAATERPATTPAAGGSSSASQKQRSAANGGERERAGSKGTRRSASKGAAQPRSKRRDAGNEAASAPMPAATPKSATTPSGPTP